MRAHTTLCLGALGQANAQVGWAGYHGRLSVTGLFEWRLYD
jgi:hypothetical protein